MDTVISRGFRESVEMRTEADRFALIHTRGRDKHITIFNEVEGLKLLDALVAWRNSREGR